MSEGVIPGLDGDIPSERRLLPDSLAAMRAKDGAATMPYGGQQAAAEPVARDHPPKVSLTSIMLSNFTVLRAQAFELCLQCLYKL